MSIKIYSNFFLSGDSNFKINYLKDKMGYRMWVHILLNNLVLLLAYEVKCYEKTVKFYPGIFEFKVFLQSNDHSNKFNLAA